MKIIILPDSFKGTISSLTVAEILKEEFQSAYPDAEILSLPFADGGENSLDCFNRIWKDCSQEHLTIPDPSKRKMIESEYLIHQGMAVIESAKAIGLDKTSIHNPALTSSYGLGLLIKDALEKNVSSFLVTLGGSCTNDGGIGMLEALGYTFYDKNHQRVISDKSSFLDICTIEDTKLTSLSKAKFQIYSDVINPLLGEDGATYRFARQKGAKEEDIPILEEAMKNFKDTTIRFTGRDFSMSDGSGAAGGLGFAFLSYFESNIVSGAEAILSLYHFDELIKGCNLIVTGEGRTDISSMEGKCISVIAKKASKKKIPLLLVSGTIDEEVIPRLESIGYHERISVSSPRRSYENIIKHPEEDLRKAVKGYLKCSI